jgi:hypothetical protein
MGLGSCFIFVLYMRFSNKLIKLYLMFTLQSNLYSMVTSKTKENNRTRQVTVYLRLINPDCQLRSIMIHVLLLPKGNSFGNIIVTL